MPEHHPTSVHSTEDGAVPVKKSQKDMTKAERKALQEQQKQEKQARRAAVVADKEKSGASVVSRDTAPSAREAAPKPGKGKDVPNPKAKDGAGAKAKEAPTTHAYWEQASLLSHIEQARGHTHTATRDVHPAILQLGLLYKSRRICGGNARCIALLAGFKRLIHDYQTPESAVLSRHLPTHLSPQITFLVSMRPMSVGMGNAIRYVKYEISILPPDWSEAQAKAHLLERIDDFVRERITLADEEIIDSALERIVDGDVIITYGRSSLIENLLLQAHTLGRQFRVIIVDGRPLNEGRAMARLLSDRGIQVTYTEVHGISTVIREASKLFLGAHAILGNGAILGRVGSAALALSAHNHRVPIVVCAETYKMTERVQLDAYVHNEIAPADPLVRPRLPSAPAVLAGWEEKEGLEVLNLMYDVTPAEWIGILITDVGPVPCSTVPVLLREYRPMAYQ